MTREQKAISILDSLNEEQMEELQAKVLEGCEIHTDDQAFAVYEAVNGEGSVVDLVLKFYEEQPKEQLKEQ